MDYALFLYCNVSKNIKSIRKKCDDHKSFPAHITLCYLKSNIDEQSLINKLKKIKKFEISLDKIDIQDDLISLKPNDTSSIDNIILIHVMIHLNLSKNTRLNGDIAKLSHTPNQKCVQKLNSTHSIFQTKTVLIQLS